MSRCEQVKHPSFVLSGCCLNLTDTLPWTCPVCQLPLTCTDRRWYCANNHSFDIAKSGYANLLLAHQKASQQPGDSPTMLQARRAFLEAGHFQPIAEAVSTSINSHLVQSPSGPYHLLDIGCGEGYYLRQITPRLQGQWITAGLDIAKDGVQMAAKSDRSSTWVCASNARLPVLDGSLDVLLQSFAPSDPEQTQRVIKNEGLLITVTPAAKHLYEIKRALYDSVRLHQKPAPPAGFKVVSEKEVSYSLSLDQTEDIKALLSMTPFFWRGHQEGREQLLRRDRLDVQVAVWISCYQKQQKRNG